MYLYTCCGVYIIHIICTYSYAAIVETLELSPELHAQPNDSEIGGMVSCPHPHMSHVLGNQWLPSPARQD